MEAHNTREEGWKIKVRDWWYSAHDFLAIKGAELNEARRVDLEHIFHQELQKARESERERIIYVTKNIKDAFMSPLTERRWLQCIQFTDQPKPKDQSELDQLDALTTLTPKT